MAELKCKLCGHSHDEHLEMCFHRSKKLGKCLCTVRTDDEDYFVEGEPIDD